MAGRVSTDWGSSASANTMASSQMFYFLLVPLFVLWLIYFKLSRRNLNKHAANIPGPPGYPIIGNLFDLMGSSHSKYKQHRDFPIAPFLFLHSNLSLFSIVFYISIEKCAHPIAVQLRKT